MIKTEQDVRAAQNAFYKYRSAKSDLVGFEELVAAKGRLMVDLDDRRFEIAVEAEAYNSVLAAIRKSLEWEISEAAARLTTLGLDIPEVVKPITAVERLGYGVEKVS
jgi:hypothetical protein